MKADLSMREKVATTALEAWNSLKSRGLETPGRDDDLVEMLRLALLENDSANAEESIEDAVNVASLEQFVRAFIIGYTVCRNAQGYIEVVRTGRCETRSKGMAAGMEWH